MARIPLTKRTLLLTAPAVALTVVMSIGVANAASGDGSLASSIRSDLAKVKSSYGDKDSDALNAALDKLQVDMNAALDAKGNSSTSTTAGDSTTSTTEKSTPTTAQGEADAMAASFENPFKGGPFKTPIPSNPKIDPNSAAMVNVLLNTKPPESDNGAGIFNLASGTGFGIPIYYADASTPKYDLSCIKGMPIPDGAKANQGADHKIVVIDKSSRKIYDLWEYRDDHASCEWAGVASIDGDGSADQSDKNPQGTTAVQISSAAGIIRNSDIEKGSIDHALVFLSSFSSPEKRWPASHSDGHFKEANGLPEGSRIQLDPSVDVDSIPGITAGEKMVAKALQKYGAYDVDWGANSAIFYAEGPINGQGSTKVLDTFGPEWSQFPHIPWDKIRVLDASVTQP